MFNDLIFPLLPKGNILPVKFKYNKVKEVMKDQIISDYSLSEPPLIQLHTKKENNKEEDKNFSKHDDYEKYSDIIKHIDIEV